MDNINKEVEYCLNCKTKPCSNKGCPLNNNIPEFIKAVKEKNYKEAYSILSETTVLPGVCGRICPHFKQCQGSCVRGIKGQPVNIGQIESFIFDEAIKNDFKLTDVIKDTDEGSKVKGKVAIIGGGPAGLTCAFFLAKHGIDVTIYEKHNYLGGLLVHGIPDFRLDKKIVKETINRILSLGIKVCYNSELGKNLFIDDLKNEFNAVYLALGANKSSKLNVEGEKLEGVYGGNELLEYNMHPDYTDKIVSVIGGGNVAIDCARVIKKMGAKEVNIIYRRSEEQMPAEKKEIMEAKQEGINFLFKNNIISIIGKQKVEKIELIKTDLIKKGEEDRLYPVNIEGTNYLIKSDYVIKAIGSEVSDEISDIVLNSRRKVSVNENNQIENSNIFAGGDLIGEKGTVAWASRSGRDSAYNISEYIKKCT